MSMFTMVKYYQTWLNISKKIKAYAVGKILAVGPYEIKALFA
jgi:hypothetical protein